MQGQPMGHATMQQEEEERSQVGHLHVISAYGVSGSEKSRHKEAARARLNTYIGDRRTACGEAGDPLVVLCDGQDIVDHRYDTLGGGRGKSPLPTSLTSACASAMVDVVRAVHPIVPLVTHWAHGSRLRGKRIDYIFATEDIAATANQAAVEVSQEFRPWWTLC